MTFTILIVTETWVALIAGYLIDRFGPRVIVCGSGALVALAWVIKSFADLLILFYLAAVIAGLGAGPIRGNCRQCAEMVFRPTRPRHGPDSRRLRRGLGANGCAARRRDPIARL